MSERRYGLKQLTLDEIERDRFSQMECDLAAHIRELEREKKRDENAIIRLNDIGADLRRERDKLAARVRELEAAVRRYGMHAHPCPKASSVSGECTCGLDAILAANPEVRT